MNLKVLTGVMLAGVLAEASLADYGTRVKGFIAGLGKDPESALIENKAIVSVSGKGVGSIDAWDEAFFGVAKPVDAVLPDEAAARELIKARKKAVAQVERTAEAPGLKKRENKVVKFLIDEGALTPTNTVVTVEKLEAMFDSWDLLPEPQAEAKSAKYERLMRPLRLRGLADTDVAFHPEVEKP